MACKAAVKAGDVLDAAQMKQLIQDLRRTDNNLTCPHGRPITWLLDYHEIEKKFKRDYRSTPKNFEQMVD
jgi:DNA mismatch repair protein MutL